MAWIKNLSRGTWIVLGIVVGLVLVPTAAVASTFVVVAGANHQTVNATANSQLLTAEAAPGSFQRRRDIQCFEHEMQQHSDELDRQHGVHCERSGH